MSWRSLNAKLKPAEFTVETVPALLKRRSDPWEDFFKVKQRIKSEYLKALGIT